MEQNQFRTQSVEELAGFFHNLFFLDVQLTRGGVFDIERMPSFVVSVYRNKADAIIGALLLDIPAAACLAGALCDLPEDLIEGIIASDSFTEDIWNDLQEVLNICSQLFTSYDGDAITLEEVYLHPATLPQEAFDVLADDFKPLLFRIAIDGYGGGVVGVLDAENNKVFADMSATADSAQTGKPENFTNHENLEQATPKKSVSPLFQDDEDEMEVPAEQPVTTVVQHTASPIPTFSFGILIGCIIGGLAAKTFWIPTVQMTEQPEGNSVEQPLVSVKPKAKEPFKHANEIKQVWIEKNAFHMGCTTEYSTECLADEFPSHSVQLSVDFYMMQHEVTQELYTQIMKQSPSRFNECGLDCPVENITWLQAAQFANALSKHEGMEPCYTIEEDNISWNAGFNCLGWRLPTEAEWEYAARGKMGQSQGRFAKNTKMSPESRTAKDVWVYAGSNTVDTVAWHGGFSKHSKDSLGRAIGSGKGTTHPVCTKEKNDLDLCDMSGNVWEWVWDGYSNYPKTTRLITGPTGNPNSKLKVLRGGSWLSSPSELRTSFRMYSGQSVVDTMVSGYGSFGIRLVRTSPAVKAKTP